MDCNHKDSFNGRLGKIYFLNSWEAVSQGDGAILSEFKVYNLGWMWGLVLYLTWTKQEEPEAT